MITRKVTLIIVLVFLASGLLSVSIQRNIIMPSFWLLEKTEARKNAARALQAIARELDQIVPIVSDWSRWTDTYKFAKGETPEYIKDNDLDGTITLTALKINFFGIFDTDGKSLITQSLDLDSGDVVDLGNLTRTGPLLTQRGLTGDIRGIIKTRQGPMLIVAKTILTSEGDGPPAGILAMGRFLNVSAIDRLSDQLMLPISVSTQVGPIVNDWLGNVSYELAHTPILLTETSEYWQARSALSDLLGSPVLEIRVDTKREISASGATAVNTTLMLLAATALVTMLVLWFLLRQAVLWPLSSLTDHVLRIGSDDNLDTKLGLTRDDEIGLLARTFDDMIDRLAEARRRLVDQSFLSGVAEMASGVLHNIGNAITPLNVKLSMLNHELKDAPVAEIMQAIRELNDPAISPERRADLARFVQLVGGELADLVIRSQQEVEASTHMVMHVRDILFDQERFSRSARVIEPVDMALVLRDSAASLMPVMKGVVEVEVMPSVHETGPVAGAYAALQQVVSNLLLNAIESVTEAGVTPGLVTVSVVTDDSDSQAMMHLCLQDNGAGIRADHLAHLFERGFSTKNRDHSGLGLHWSANTVQVLGGRITAESAGPGKGACFHVWLPLAGAVDVASNGTDD